MPSTAAPFGLRPAYHPSGTIRQSVGTIDTGYSANIFKGSPIALTTAGVINLAAAGARATGAFVGCEYTPTDGRRRVSNMWPASTTATEIVCYYVGDPDVVYEVQASGTLAITDVGSQFDWGTNNTSSGSTLTGISNVALNISSGASNAGLQVLGLVPNPDNAWGDTYVNVFVRISEHTHRADVAAY